MIEAVNSIENGPYLLTSTAAAARFIAEVGVPEESFGWLAWASPSIA
jgi:hypothetical protein